MAQPCIPVAFLALCVGVAGSFACGEFARRAEEIRPLAPDQLLEVVGAPNGPLLLDVRTTQEFRRGHVPGAVLIPHDQLAQRLNEIEMFRARGVVVYCQTGRRARIAMQVLSEAGFRHLAHLEGDFSRWQQERRLIQASEPP